MTFDPTINPNTVAARAAVLGFLTHGAMRARTEVNDQAHASMLPDGRVPAVVAGRVVGRFNMPKDPTSVEITDWGALLRWCQQHRPDVVQPVQVNRVDPLFVRWLLDHVRSVGAPVDADGVQVDGVTVTVRGAEPTMTFTDDAQDLLGEALADPAARPAMVAALQDAVSQILGVPGLRIHLPGGAAEDPAGGDLSEQGETAAAASPPDPFEGPGTGAPDPVDDHGPRFQPIAWLE